MLPLCTVLAHNAKLVTGHQGIFRKIPRNGQVSLASSKKSS